ncbi:MAG: hypothetical protein AVDCRST_MAG54-4823, partial [uncultured Actinomycetospora sp.]
GVRGGRDVCGRHVGRHGQVGHVTRQGGVPPAQPRARHGADRPARGGHHRHVDRRVHQLDRRVGDLLQRLPRRRRREPAVDRRPRRPGGRRPGRRARTRAQRGGPARPGAAGGRRAGRAGHRRGGAARQRPVLPGAGPLVRRPDPVRPGGRLGRPDAEPRPPVRRARGRPAVGQRGRPGAGRRLPCHLPRPARHRRPARPGPPDGHRRLGRPGPGARRRHPHPAALRRLQQL